MPVARPSPQPEARLETSPNGSYYTLIPNIHFGLLALLALIGTRYFIKSLSSRQHQLSTLVHYRTRISPAREIIWSTEEKSRVVSISGGSSGNMSASKADVSLDSFDEESIGAVLEEKADSTAADTSADGRQSAIVSRPPPPPPLEFPQLSPTVFAFDDRRRSFPEPELPVFDTQDFIHQPNPDYTGESSSSALEQTDLPLESGSATTPKRRSYTRTVPFSARPGVDSEFAPSSFPLSSPHLPPPAEFPEIGHFQHDIDIQGEIISSLDDAGHGWKRHTRVYGGGVCLACLQSGGEGGFYGENVRPEDRR